MAFFQNRLGTVPQWFALLVIGITIQTSQGLTLDELRADSALTPQRFATHFTSFKFKFRAEVQDPEVFLATRVGDCDDYAILAAMVLREKGYTPRLIAVRMKGLVHVVCYVNETKSFLDYNYRRFAGRMVSCEPDLKRIAAKVAKSLNAKWHSVSEFTFDTGLKRLVKTVKPEPPTAGPSFLSSL